MEKLESKILGCLSAGAIGDSLGSATEQMTMDQILERYGGFIDKFYKPGEDRPFSAGRKAGQITDDTGQMMELIEEYLKLFPNPITPKAAADSLLRWARDPELVERFAGPTTKQAIYNLRNGLDPISVGLRGGTSNGCAMKIAPAGLFHPGDLNAAIHDACVICQATHANQIAMSASSAVAAGIAEALKDDTNIFLVIKACMYGAIEGEKIGKKMGKIVCGASVLKRMKLSATIAIENDNLEEVCRNISAYVGSGIPANEAVPAAIGIVLATGGEPFKAISMGATIGNDTDTVAMIAGIISGAFFGFEGVPNNLFEELEEVNNLNLKEKAHKIYCKITSI